MSKKQINKKHAPSIFATSSPSATINSQVRLYKADELVVDEEFEHLLGKRSEEEILSLEHEILRDGITDSIKVWVTNGTRIVVDGMTRRRIAKKHGLSFRIEIKQFKDREDVIFWMITNQTARRDLTYTRKIYLIGLEYNQLKKDPKASLLQYMPPLSQTDTAVQVTDLQLVTKSKPDDDSPLSQTDTAVTDYTAELVGKKHKISRAAVFRASLSYLALQKIKVHSTEFFEKTLNETTGVTAAELEAYAKLEKPSPVKSREQLKALLVKPKTTGKKKSVAIETFSAKASTSYKKYFAKPTSGRKSDALEKLKALAEQVQSAIEEINNHPI